MEAESSKTAGRIRVSCTEGEYRAREHRATKKEKECTITCAKQIKKRRQNKIAFS